MNLTSAGILNASRNREDHQQEEHNDEPLQVLAARTWGGGGVASLRLLAAFPGKGSGS
jgi:hypothetical protein